MSLCLNCEKPLEEVFKGSKENNQFRDALDIQVHLGYGEFSDQGENQIGSPRGLFCKKCATELVLQFPGIRKLIFG